MDITFISFSPASTNKNLPVFITWFIYKLWIQRVIYRLPQSPHHPNFFTPHHTTTTTTGVAFSYSVSYNLEVLITFSSSPPQPTWRITPRVESCTRHTQALKRLTGEIVFWGEEEQVLMSPRVFFLAHRVCMCMCVWVSVCESVASEWVRQILSGLRPEINKRH